MMTPSGLEAAALALGSMLGRAPAAPEAPALVVEPLPPPQAARAAARPAARPMVEVSRMKSRREARGAMIVIDDLLKSDVCCLTLIG